MTTFIDYFSEDNIVKLLCKYRAKHAHKRHKMHMLRDISISKSTDRIKQEKYSSEFKFLTTLFPSRRKWKKLKQSERKQYPDSVKRNYNQLYKSYKTYSKLNIPYGEQEKWFRLLSEFVQDIQFTIQDIDKYNLAKPVVRGIFKKQGVVNEYRPITLYELKDKIITTLSARYFTDIFDDYFFSCAFAFRSKLNKDFAFNHHECINSINNYKKDKENLWVAECDIQKFFDTVNHKHIKKVFLHHIEALENKNNKIVDTTAIKIFDKFLESFAFNFDVYTKNDDTKWWIDNRYKPNSQFKWVEETLRKAYGNQYLDYRIGVPQGNALSCFVANLLLHNVDEKVLKLSNDLLYIRFCDDMVVMHKDRDTCAKALEIYKESLLENYLVFHNPEKCLGYLNKNLCRAFWRSKSKEPYLWSNPYKIGEAIPWLSFVGYQIKYTGEIRIRKSSIDKEKRKQVKEVENILNAVEYYKNNVNNASRKSKKQIIHSLNERLVSMSVGRVEFHNYKDKNQGLCWTNGFRSILNSDNDYIDRQLRSLDNFREKQVWRLKQHLRQLEKDSYKPKTHDKKYFGSPFSYYNYIVQHVKK